MYHCIAHNTEHDDSKLEDVSTTKKNEMSLKKVLHTCMVSPDIKLMKVTIYTLFSG